MHCSTLDVCGIAAPRAEYLVYNRAEKSPITVRIHQKSPYLTAEETSYNLTALESNSRPPSRGGVQPGNTGPVRPSRRCTGDDDETDAGAGDQDPSRGLPPYHKLPSQHLSSSIYRRMLLAVVVVRRRVRSANSAGDRAAVLPTSTD
jgi:hypothetical protein